jgi:DNA invertase Pin-like site-specific DNA recombinase
MHDQYTLTMQIDAMRACAIQQHGTVADSVEEVASDATDQRPKRQVRLKAATPRQRDVMLVWKLDRSGHCLGDGMST